MLMRLVSLEAGALRRSFVLWIGVLIAVGGSVLARSLAWIGHALAQSELRGLLLVNLAGSWGDVAVPLALLSYLIVVACQFGRDFEDGSIDLLLTAPIRRDALVFARGLVVTAFVFLLAVLAWFADAATCALLARSPFDPGAPIAPVAVLGSACAAVATLPLVGWACMRFRSVLPALGAGIGVEVVVLALGRISYVRLLPWYLPSAFAAGLDVPPVAALLSVVLFLGGLALALRGIATVDLVE
jgi:hypothetical protein